MAIPLALLAGKALFSLGVRVLGKRATQAALKKGGDKNLQKLISKAQKSKSPKQKEMFNKSGTVKASVKKSSAKKPTTTKPKVKGKPKKQSYLEKLFKPLSKNQKTSKSGSLAQASVIKRGAAKAVGGAAVGYAAGKGSNKSTNTKPTTTKTTKAKSKKVSPSQTPKQALAMKNKKIAAAKKRLEDKKKLEAKNKNKSKSSNRPMDNMGGFGRSNFQKYLRRK